MLGEAKGPRPAFSGKKEKSTQAWVGDRHSYLMGAGDGGGKKRNGALKKRGRGRKSVRGWLIRKGTDYAVLFAKKMVALLSFSLGRKEKERSVAALEKKETESSAHRSSQKKKASVALSGEGLRCRHVVLLSQRGKKKGAAGPKKKKRALHRQSGKTWGGKSGTPSGESKKKGRGNSQRKR